MDCLNQIYTIALRLSGRVVMQRIANPSTPVRFRPQPLIAREKKFKMVYNIGIIGKGFVGSAVSHGFSTSVGYDAKIRIYDKDDSKSLNSLDEVVSKSDFVFIQFPHHQIKMVQ